MLRRVLADILLIALTLAVLPLTACTPAQTEQGEKQVRQQSMRGLVILYFYGQKCNLCTVQARELDKFQSYSNVPVQKILPDAAMIRKYGLTRTPTLVFLKDSRVLETRTGVTYEEELKALTKKYGSPAP